MWGGECSENVLRRECVDIVGYFNGIIPPGKHGHLSTYRAHLRRDIMTMNSDPVASRLGADVAILTFNLALAHHLRSSTSLQRCRSNQHAVNLERGGSATAARIGREKLASGCIGYGILVDSVWSEGMRGMVAMPGEVMQMRPAHHWTKLGVSRIMVICSAGRAWPKGFSLFFHTLTIPLTTGLD